MWTPINKESVINSGLVIDCKWQELLHVPLFFSLEVFLGHTEPMSCEEIVALVCYCNNMCCVYEIFYEQYI